MNIGSERYATAAPMSLTDCLSKSSASTGRMATKRLPDFHSHIYFSCSLSRGLVWLVTNFDGPKQVLIN
jgi:hypothetical protein